MKQNKEPIGIRVIDDQYTAVAGLLQELRRLEKVFGGIEVRFMPAQGLSPKERYEGVDIILLDEDLDDKPDGLKGATVERHMRNAGYTGIIACISSRLVGRYVASRDHFDKKATVATNDAHRNEFVDWIARLIREAKKNRKKAKQG
ncbi:hypothetical protein ACFL2D_00750 [Patescibacteria group bacterium]